MEWVRLFRTRRWIALLAGYLLFGFLMPILTRYQEEIFRHVGGDVKVIMPPPTPSAAVASYISNASQVGLLVAVVIAAGALAFDARPEWSSFLRTRARTMSTIVLPKSVVCAVAVGLSFAAGMLAASYETSVLIGPLPAGGMLAGTLYGFLYLVFAVGVVTLCASLTRSVIGTAGLALGILIVLPILGQAAALKPWLPSELVGAPVALVDGKPAAEFLRAAASAAAVTAAATWFGVRRLARREL